MSPTKGIEGKKRERNAPKNICVKEKEKESNDNNNNM